jgi:hypothetical protein
MLKARTIIVGDEPVDLTAGSALSGVTIQLLRPGRDENGNARVLYVADSPDVEEGEEPVALGVLSDGTRESLPSVALAPQEHLWIWHDPGVTAPVDVILRWG